MHVPLMPNPVSGSPPGQDVNALTLLAAVVVLVPVSLWVYNDAKMRYNTRSAPLLWSALVFSALIIFLPVYLLMRPPKRRPHDAGQPPAPDR